MKVILNFLGFQLLTVCSYLKGLPSVNTQPNVYIKKCRDFYLLKRRYTLVSLNMIV